ncbi:hypothetical protein AMECASPLE_026599 [Ameca splendens]|uniref:Uncharacterized protein n=1 Tax=Ameca splendens TaxID=208324 RepID=A0ABV0YH72_9TELE
MCVFLIKPLQCCEDRLIQSVPVAFMQIKSFCSLLNFKASPCHTLSNVTVNLKPERNFRVGSGTSRTPGFFLVKYGPQDPVVNTVRISRHCCGFISIYKSIFAVAKSKTGIFSLHRNYTFYGNGAK